MKNRNSSLLIIFFVYLSACYAGWILILNLNAFHPLLKLFFADILATFIVYIFSMIFKNASIYDPYWSVAPIIFVFYWFWEFKISLSNLFSLYKLRIVFISLLVMIWGFRLTYNWLQEFTGLDYEDWRYRNYRKSNPKIFWVINLTGIQLFPTILVFLGSLSLYPALEPNFLPLNALDIIGIIISLFAIIIESLADRQMRNFRNNRRIKENIMREGIWKLSRHPNYFGEISFWWGLFFFALAVSLENWWMIIGPISINLLFLFISIPLIERRHLSRKPEYKNYIEQVSKLIPWFTKNKKK